MYLECQRHLGKVWSRKGALTQYQEVLQCSASILCHHAMSLCLYWATATILISILPMLLLLFSNTLVGYKRKKEGDPWNLYARFIGNAPHWEPGVLRPTGALSDKGRWSGALGYQHSPACWPDRQHVLWHAACPCAALYPFQHAHREWLQLSSVFSAKDASDL